MDCTTKKFCRILTWEEISSRTPRTIADIWGSCSSHDRRKRSERTSSPNELPQCGTVLQKRLWDWTNCGKIIPWSSTTLGPFLKNFKYWLYCNVLNCLSCIFYLLIALFSHIFMKCFTPWWLCMHCFAYCQCTFLIFIFHFSLHWFMIVSTWFKLFLLLCMHCFVLLPMNCSDFHITVFIFHWSDFNKFLMLFYTCLYDEIF